MRLTLLPLVAILILLCFAVAVDRLNSGRQTESLRRLEEAVRRSCVACYAVEGAYPPSIEYLEEHYGIQVDREHYTVHYEISGPNLMPNITVLEKTP